MAQPIVWLNHLVITLGPYTIVSLQPSEPLEKGCRYEWIGYVASSQENQARPFVFHPTGSTPIQLSQSPVCYQPLSLANYIASASETLQASSFPDNLRNTGHLAS